MNMMQRHLLQIEAAKDYDSKLPPPGLGMGFSAWLAIPAFLESKTASCTEDNAVNQHVF